jgi:glycosyltransferase involved in cell wall biosynthesis
VINSIHTKKNVELTTNIDLTIFESEIIENQYRALGGACRSVVIPNGMNVKEIKLDVPLKARNLVSFIGRMAPEKDPFTFLRIVQHLVLLYKLPEDLKFIMVGDGPLLPSILDEIKKNNLPIAHLGFQPDAEVYLKRSRVFVQCSSEAEGRPNVVIEAMANSVPVVAYNSGAVSELFENGISGFLHQRGSVEKMCESVYQLLVDDKKFESFSIAAREFAESRFELSSVILKYEKILDKELGRLTSSESDM